ncbi:hypothetical protein PIB30_046563 [Stylosanthes scabra]|uniref:Uncharacterized protein n=1 Tax=Stylosanthes scabra TaxID=79078 RepID=A0ABU6VEY8_9FABA|nr:hypothetical protein [Stylosanthes scabra]
MFGTKSVQKSPPSDSVIVAAVEPRKRSRARVIVVARGGAVSSPPVRCSRRSPVVLGSRPDAHFLSRLMSPPFTMSTGTLDSILRGFQLGGKFEKKKDDNGEEEREGFLTVKDPTHTF